jgi:hypothetical protein
MIGPGETNSWSNPLAATTEVIWNLCEYSGKQRKSAILAGNPDAWPDVFGVLTRHRAKFAPPCIGGSKASGNGEV